VTFAAPDDFSVQTALLVLPLWTIVQRSVPGKFVDDPPVLGVQEKMFVVPSWSTRVAVVQFQRRPGHLGPA